MRKPKWHLMDTGNLRCTICGKGRFDEDYVVEKNKFEDIRKDRQCKTCEKKFQKMIFP